MMPQLAWVVKQKGNDMVLVYDKYVRIVCGNVNRHFLFLLYLSNLRFVWILISKLIPLVINSFTGAIV